MTNLEYCNEILSIIGNVTEANDAIYNLAYDAYLKLGGQESQPSLATIYNELKSAIQIWDNTDSLNITENGTYNLLGKSVTVNVQGASLPPDDEIWYTSTDGRIVTPWLSTSLPTIISNTYVNGKGIMKFSQRLTEVGQFAFLSRSNLFSIIFPSSITNWGAGQFWYSSNLVSVTYLSSKIPLNSYSSTPSLTNIVLSNNLTELPQYYAFRGFSGTSLVYLGTMAYWNLVTQYAGSWRESNITTIHCTDGDITR